MCLGKSEILLQFLERFWEKAIWSSYVGKPINFKEKAHKSKNPKFHKKTGFLQLEKNCVEEDLKSLMKI